MDFDLSDDQRQIKDSVDRMLAAAYADLKSKVAAQKEPAGFSAASWKQYADLGLLGIPFAEEQGGLGAGPVETMLVMDAIGRNEAIEPYLSTVVLGGGILRHAGSDAQKAALIPDVIEGKRRLGDANFWAGGAPTPRIQTGTSPIFILLAPVRSTLRSNMRSRTRNSLSTRCNPTPINSPWR